MSRNTSRSPIYSAPILKTGLQRAKNLNRMNDSAKNCQDVMIVGEKCSRAHLRSVRAPRAHPRVKNQPYGWNSHKFLPPNMRLMTTLI